LRSSSGEEQGRDQQPEGRISNTAEACAGGLGCYSGASRQATGWLTAAPVKQLLLRSGSEGN
jgi:hypothetical protein